MPFQIGMATSLVIWILREAKPLSQDHKAGKQEEIAHIRLAWSGIICQFPPWALNPTLYALALTFLRVLMLNHTTFYSSLSCPRIQWSPTFCHQGLISWKMIFPWTKGQRGHLRMIQTHYIYRELYFYFYYMSSTWDHQPLDYRGWGPLEELAG